MFAVVSESLFRQKIDYTGLSCVAFRWHETLRQNVWAIRLKERSDGPEARV